MLDPAITVSVALRKESVDRNFAVIVGQHQAHASLSARRAWIEILGLGLGDPARVSLSARRAWIEIPTRTTTQPSTSVALRKESVDRNLVLNVRDLDLGRRSPQGERG